MFAGSASSAQLFLTCETRAELKTVNSSKQVTQDERSANHIELQIDGDVYHVSLTHSRGSTTNINGHIIETATKYILNPDMAAKPNQLSLDSQAYVDRQAGTYVHYFILPFPGTENVTTWNETGPCKVTDRPKTKF